METTNGFDYNDTLDKNESHFRPSATDMHYDKDSKNAMKPSQSMNAMQPYPKKKDVK